MGWGGLTIALLPYAIKYVKTSSKSLKYSTLTEIQLDHHQYMAIMYTSQSKHLAIPADSTHNKAS